MTTDAFINKWFIDLSDEDEFKADLKSVIKKNMPTNKERQEKALELYPIKSDIFVLGTTLHDTYDRGSPLRFAYITGRLDEKTQIIKNNNER